MEPTTYGIVSIVPVIVLIVVALITKRTFESLLIATLLALILGYKGDWFYALIEQIQTVSAENVWVLLVVGLLLGAVVIAAVVVALHLWKHNNLLSIFGGTILYMVLVQAVF